jgi:hypothetical protein
VDACVKPTVGEHTFDTSRHAEAREQEATVRRRSTVASSPWEVDVLASRRNALRASTAALLVAGLAVAPGSFAVRGMLAGGSASYPRLAGLTTITAERTSRAVVDLPREVALATAPGDGHVRGLTLSGPGRIVGLSLVSLSGTTGLVETEFRPCFTAGCTAGVPGYPREPLATTWQPTPPPTGVSSPGPTFRLPAGRYLLSVYADSAPVTVIWRLPGLGGRSHLRLRLPQHAQLASPAEQTATPGAPATFSSQSMGSGSVTTSVGVLGFVHVAESSPHVQNTTSWCIYDRNGPPGGRIVPGCPDADSVSTGGILVTARLRSMSWGMLVASGGAAGGYVQGVDDTGVQALTDVHDTLLWADVGMPVQKTG